MPHWQSMSQPNNHLLMLIYQSRMSLADAQTLAIRRLLSKAVYDNNVAPGPPLPKSHPLPSTLAKLHIECASLYLSSKLLAKTPGATKGSSSDATKEVSSELRRYLGNQATLHSALSHKWLGVEAGEQGGSQRGGEAVAFLQWAKKELEELKDGGKLVSFGSADKEKEEHWKADLNNELTSVNAFHKYYKKMNDTVCSRILFRDVLEITNTFFFFRIVAFPASTNTKGFTVSHTRRANCHVCKTLSPACSCIWSGFRRTYASNDRATRHFYFY